MCVRLYYQQISVGIGLESGILTGFWVILSHIPPQNSCLSNKSLLSFKVIVKSLNCLVN